MKQRVLTGDRPTGSLHLGHYCGSLMGRLVLQETCDQLVMIADVQALTDHFDRSHHIAKNVAEVAKDYLSIGLDPNLTTIFIQSQVPQLHELTTYFLNMVTLGRLERNPTVKTEIQQKGFGDSLPVGFLCYPISQAADITMFKAEVVPVGNDQLPMLEQTNEIVRRFNRTYHTDCLVECQPYLGHSPRLSGIDGKAKASKSLNNAIFLSDSPYVVHQKVMQMYTDPGHLRISDPGRVEGNIVFEYLDAFHSDAAEVVDLKAQYQRGGLGDITLKNILNDSLNKLLDPIRQRRESITDTEVCDVLRDGCDKAQAIAAQTMLEVREVMGLGRYY